MVMVADLLAEGLRLHQAGQLTEAEPCYRQVLEELPDHSEAAFLLGSLLLQARRAPEAMEFLKRVVESNPAHATARNNLGTACFITKNFVDALEQFQYLAEVDPENWSYHYRIASCAQELKLTELMLQHMRRALSLNFFAPDAREFITATLTGQGHFISAACFVEQWSRLPGLSAKGKVLMAESLAKGNLFIAANSLLAEIQADNLRYWPIRAFVEYQQQRYEEAIVSFEEAIQSYQLAHPNKPKDPLSLTNLGVIKLTLGRMEEGWRDFGARFAPGGPLHSLAVDAPEWDGRPLHGETVLVHSEQGFGDVIQFMRFFPRIEAAGGRLLFTSYPDVIQLLKTQQGATSHTDVEKFDLSYQWQIPLLSLGKIYANDLDALPTEPYVEANPERVELWRSRLGLRQGVRVGLVWAGSPIHGNDANRSAALDDFALLGDVPGVHFYGLQKGASESQALSAPLGLNIVSLSADIRDFADTAAILSEMDLLICVDTSVAHLAGALGKPVWVIVPSEFDWRWLQDREDSPWYPSMRLFRLKNSECWADLMPKVQAALIDFSRNRTQATDAATWAAFDRWKQGDVLAALSAYLESPAQIPCGLLTSPCFKERSVYEAGAQVLAAHAFPLGLLQSANGHVDAALATLQQVGVESSDACRSLRAQAAMLSLQGKRDSLLQLAEDGITRFPTCLEFVYWRAQALRMTGRWQDAVNDYREFLKIAPRNPKAMINLSYCLGQLGRTDDALNVLERAVLSNTKNELAWQQLELLLDRRNSVQVSRFVTEHIVRLFPDSASALLRQSVARSRCGDALLAKDDIEHALALDPDMPDRVFYQATAYAMGDAWSKAIPLFEQAFNEDPSRNSSAMWLAQHFLREGEWERGWSYWEGRLCNPKSDSIANVLPALNAPRWDGSSLGDRVLMVFCEQGFGDTLNFLHLLERIKGKVILVVQDGLFPLFAKASLNCEMMTRSAAKIAVPVCDVAIELMSLPFVMALGGNLAPVKTAYLTPDLSNQRLLNQLDALQGLRVGLVWAGNPAHGDTHFRDCPFDVIAPLLSLQGISWCSLQKDDASNQVLFVPGAADLLNNVAPELETWLDTATILQQLDLVITVDTALAHLAASMGCPVWLLLSKRNDWRWGDSGETTVWYPSVRLYRQRQLNDWVEVIGRVRSDLEKWEGGPA